MSDDAPTQRLRARFSKLGKIRFTSQRDVARVWERALRRSGLPVAWSEGFSPRPLLSFGLGLPTGCESLAEYLDIRLARPEGDIRLAPPGGDIRLAPVPPGRPDLAEELSDLLPEGIVVQAVAPLEHGSGSLQQEVTSCTWELEVVGLTDRELAERVERMLAAPSIPLRRERKGRPVDDDIRPSVRSLVPMGRSCLRAELATQPRGVRPKELLEGLGAELSLARARRTHQWIERDGARREPLAGSSAGAAPT